MAIDPKARRAAIHYTKGRVTACLGLLEYLFVADPNPASAEVAVGPGGKRRLKNLIRRVTASGGKQLDVFTKDGKTYQIHYSGTLVDWRLYGVPKLDRTVVMGWSTKRGSMQYV